jgi:adenosylhomocysteine nucleosidase
MKTLVITPLRDEQALFLQKCIDKGYMVTETRVGRLPVFELPEIDLSLALGGTGKVQFAVQTQHLLDSGVIPDLVICAGAAGSLVDYLGIGDVVVASETVEHDVRERFSRKPLPRFKADSSMIESLALVPPTSLQFPVHFGVVASGDEDVIDEARKSSLHQISGGIAVAWEGAGGAKACRFSGIPFVEIRGITDAADSGAPADFELNLSTAMGNIATFIMAWILLESNG